MRCLNEHIARRANEDGCTGYFWEGRFKTQALLDEPAVLARIAYVDLNFVRACIAETPEGSDYTSIQKHIQHRDTPAGKAVNQGEGKNEQIAPRILPLMTENTKEDNPAYLTVCDFRLMYYLELVDWTGSAMRDEKRARLSGSFPLVLSRPQISQDVWLRYLRSRVNRRLVAIGYRKRLRRRVLATATNWSVLWRCR